MKIRDRVGPLTDDNVEIITDDVRTAKVLNFASVFTLEQMHIYHNQRIIFAEPMGDVLGGVEATRGTFLKFLQN